MNNPCGYVTGGCCGPTKCFSCMPSCGDGWCGCTSSNGMGCGEAIDKSCMNCTTCGACCAGTAACLTCGGCGSCEACRGGCCGCGKDTKTIDLSKKRSINLKDRERVRDVDHQNRPVERPTELRASQRRDYEPREYQRYEPREVQRVYEPRRESLRESPRRESPRVVY